ncbi:MAG TPA: hypothetical protein VGK01_08735 [Candidatus Angelobacter sp.]
MSELAPLSALPLRSTVKLRVLDAVDAPSAIAEPALILVHLLISQRLALAIRNS